MKAILLIDEMPKNCDECPLQRWGIDGWNCTPKNEVIEDDKPEWCPLKPLPKPINPVIARQCKQDEPLYQEGWNDCLEEIECD